MLNKNSNIFWVLAVIAIIGPVIAANVWAITLVYDDYIELSLIGDSESEEYGKVFYSLVENIIFVIIFPLFIRFEINLMLKFRRNYYQRKKETIKKSGTESEQKSENMSDVISSSKSSPQKLIFLYIILLPSIHAIVVMFSGNIIGIYKNPAEADSMDLMNVFMYSAFVLWGITGKKYLWLWKNMKTSKWFEIFGYEFIIAERRILNNVIIGTFIVAILSLIILLVFSPPKSASNGLELWELFSLGIFFNLFIILLFSFTKLYHQGNKRDFHLFVASGFCKKAIDVEDNVKSHYIRSALKSYNNFFKRNHNDHILKNPELINIEILSKKINTNFILGDISRSFESGNGLLPLEKFVTLMGKTKEELLTDNSLKEQIRYWSGYFGPIVGGITATIFGIILSFLFLVG